jgi:2-polyprenyl-3-methyl-5-hydroxy-6-metoxy-1,4-benzoquinol methylase
MKRGLSEKKVWDKVKAVLGDRRITLGNHWSYNLYNDPKRLAFVLSRYKFAAKMASKGKSILELGCSEGIGAPILSEFARDYTGVDMDGEAIETARGNWDPEKTRFIEDDFLGKRYGRFDAAVSLDVVEHIVRKKERSFFMSLYDNLKDDGIAIVGTPNRASAAYASKASRLGHVNLFDGDRLIKTMQKYFRTVFIFGMNDEMVHTGFLPMAHYLLCVGCGKNRRIGK